MPEDTSREWPVVDGAPLNPYDVDTSKMRDDDDEADAATPKGDHVDDRDAMSAPADDMAAAVPGPGGGEIEAAHADEDDEDRAPKRKGK